MFCRVRSDKAPRCARFLEINMAKKSKVSSTKRYAGIYVRWLINIPKSEPLYGMPYFGQVNRISCNSVDEAVRKRWREENRMASKSDKEVGLMAVIAMYGPDALKNEIIHRNEGKDRKALQKWVDELEKKCISDYGGPFRDDGSKCTLNLTMGGQGTVNFESFDAFRTMKWKRFARELIAYIDCNNTALVKSKYVSPSGYRLGKHVVGVRTGILLHGHPKEAERVAWLNTLPGWVWRALDSPDHISYVAKKAKDQHSNASEETRASWNRAKSVGHLTPMAVEASSSIASKHWETGTGFASEHAKAKSAAIRSTHEYRATSSSIKKEAAAIKHASAMEGMNNEEKAEYQLKVDRRRKQNSARERALAALRKIPGWENSGLNHLKKARELGVIKNFHKAGNFDNAYESQKAALAELKKITGWENSIHRDIAKARKLGLIPDGRKRKRDDY